MNNVIPIDAAVRRHSGRSRAHLHQNPSIATKSPESAVQALLARLHDLHSRHCPCVGIPEVRRCLPLERRLILALKALSRGASTDEAVEVAGSFGVHGSVEVRS